MNEDNSGLGVGDVSGVLLFCRGVFVCQATEILDLSGLESYRNLKKHAQHFTLIVNGDFELTQERTCLDSSERMRLYRLVLTYLFLRCIKFAPFCCYC